MDNEERKRFGAYLRSLRNQRGLSQREVNALANVSSAYLTQVENGQRNPPSAEVLKRLAQVYQVKPEDLMREAGYLAGCLSSVPSEVIERAFRFVCDDPEFSFGTRLTHQGLTKEAKASIVMLYQKWKGKLLLTDEELNAAIEGDQK